MTIVGIFAHPDDEAFGPAGTLALLSKEHDVYIICVTNGDATFGKPDPKLALKRREELTSSAAILGIKKVFFLDFGDGTLSNGIYHTVADKIRNILDELKPERLITIDPRGISGHIDHIAVSMITSFVFEKVTYAKEIWYSCISERIRKLMPPYFIYFPPGYKKEEIDKTIDISSVWSLKKKAIMQHSSQLKDVVGMLAILSIVPKEEYFLVRKK